MRKNTQFLHTPPGSKPLYKEEAIFRNTISRNLSAYFEKWNYFPVETPIIDYFDIYQPFLTEKQKRGTLRFVNRDGDLVLLRNDITLFAAKSLASRITGIEETMKYYYSGQIIRGHEKDIPEEYYQIGCEIVSSKFTLEEIEILTLLIESALHLGLENFSLHIGDISLFNKLLGHINKEIRSTILSYIKSRDISRLKETLDQHDIADSVKNDCISIASFMGTLAEFKKLKLSDAGIEAAHELVSVVEKIIMLGYEDKIIIDTSELSELDYYNGIIFHLYAEGAETPLASGGRYDLLFKELGLKKNAVGFSYWLYPLEKLLSRGYCIQKDWNDIEIDKNDFTKGFKYALNSVKSGNKVNLNY